MKNKIMFKKQFEKHGDSPLKSNGNRNFSKQSTIEINKNYK